MGIYLANLGFAADTVIRVLPDYSMSVADVEPVSAVIGIDLV
jgi:hypothetical protein